MLVKLQTIEEETEVQALHILEVLGEAGGGGAYGGNGSLNGGAGGTGYSKIYGAESEYRSRRPELEIQEEEKRLMQKQVHQVQGDY